MAFALTFVLIHIGTIALATVLYRISPFHPLAKFPGPLINKMTSLRLAQVVWTGKRHLYVYDLHEKYGKVVRTGPNTLSFNSHAAVTPVYACANAFSKGEAYVPGKIDGSGLFFIQSKGEHNARRRHWASAFTPAAIANYKPVVEKRTNQLMDCILERREGTYGAVDLSEAIQHWSYDTMGDLTFGGANRLELMKDRDAGNYVESGQLATIAFECFGEVPALFNILCYLPVTKTITLLEKLAGKLIDVRQKNPTDQTDIASFLLGENDEKRPKLNQKDLRIDALFAIQAGSDTTAGVLIYLFYFLLTEKDAYNRLREELDNAFPDPDAPLDLATLDSLPYLNAVLDESLRLGTPFPGLPRVAPQGGAMVDGVYIPEDTIVGVPAYTQQTSPDNFWPAPKSFLPERWLPGGLGPGSIARKSAIMCFSYGPFGCLGKSLALQEMRVVAAKMLLTYDLYLAPDFDRTKFVDGIKNMRTTIFEYPLNVVAHCRH
ncbi:cytochrome P450 [Obba rivulosa]|uniref:Cytochrome P450 n=1 Tax=Obba rivulosa TaxID=1052685 RepID=A0A8E2DUK7_9APHY|nr:cytochrome P450 [Obba rivulosa]